MYTLRIKHKHSFHCILCIYFNFLFQFFYFFYFFRVVVIRLRLHTVCILIRTRHTNRYVCLERAEVQRSIKSTYQAKTKSSIFPKERCSCTIGLELVGKNDYSNTLLFFLFFKKVIHVCSSIIQINPISRHINYEHITYTLIQQRILTITHTRTRI